MKIKNVHRARSAQSGAVLMIGMVMLLMVSLIAVSVIRLSTRHTQVVSNEQVRTEAVAAANYALDTVLNEPYTTWDPYKATGTTTSVNLGTSKTADSTAVSMNVTVDNLTCKRARVLKNSELLQKSSTGVYYVSATDSSCFGAGGSTGLTIVDPSKVGSANDDSLCATVLYDLQAQANDPKLLNAAPVVQQGVEVRTDITTLSSSCS
jgi:Tfp pilus assembly protein PilX